jgi:3-keto-disaccharide hydrolase
MKYTATACVSVLAVLCAFCCGSTRAEDNLPPAGFKALFNGQDLTGWQGLVEIWERDKLSPEQLAKKQKEANEKYLPHWSVRSGVLHYDGKGQSLQTAKDYGDFELLVDWRIEKKGDSGIYLRGNPQVQIWDPDAGEQNAVGSGGLFNNTKNPNKPSKRADRPVGEWNTFRIVMKGDKVSVWLNGELVVDNVTMENYWARVKDKDSERPIPARGPIELQHHSDPLEFKNIYIKEL